MQLFKLVLLLACLLVFLWQPRVVYAEKPTVAKGFVHKNYAGEQSLVSAVAYSPIDDSIAIAGSFVSEHVQDTLYATKDNRNNILDSNAATPQFVLGGICATITASDLVATREPALYVAKLDKNGSCSWAHAFQFSAATLKFENFNGAAISVHEKSGSIAIFFKIDYDAPSKGASLNFGGHCNNVTLPQYGSRQNAVAMFSKDGVCQWVWIANSYYSSGYGGVAFEQTTGDVILQSAENTNVDGLASLPMGGNCSDLPVYQDGRNVFLVARLNGSTGECLARNDAWFQTDDLMSWNDLDVSLKYNMISISAHSTTHSLLSLGDKCGALDMDGIQGSMQPVFLVYNLDDLTCKWVAAYQQTNGAFAGHAIDPQTGDIVVTGSVTADMTFALGSANACKNKVSQGHSTQFVARLSSDGVCKNMITLDGLTTIDDGFLIDVSIGRLSGSIVVSTSSCTSPVNVSSLGCNTRSGDGLLRSVYSGNLKMLDSIVYAMTADLSTCLFAEHYGGSEDDQLSSLSLSTDETKIFTAGLTKSSDFQVVDKSTYPMKSWDWDGYVVRLDVSCPSGKQLDCVGGITPSPSAMKPLNSIAVVNGATHTAFSWIVLAMATVLLVALL